jgi:hypothetical protein
VRPSARVTEVKPFQPGERTDVVAVRAEFDYAYGAVWWAEDAPGPALGARYTVVIEVDGVSKPLDQVAS